MKVAILGTRGIPAEYGGFEQFAHFFSRGLVEKKIDVTVYNPHNHYTETKKFEGVNIIHKWCPEKSLGPFSHFIYDYLCLKDAIKKDFDIILELGYTSLAPAFLMLSFKNSKIITNLDGLEEKRSKWNPLIKKIIKLSQKIVCHRSHFLISDNEGIQSNIFNEYGKKSKVIPYGANVINYENINEQILKQFSIQKNNYFMSLGRMEPENNLEMMLDGYKKSGSNLKYIVVSNFENKYGKYLLEKYKNCNIDFLGPIYDVNTVNSLRYFSKIYFHGHTVGGTNPSLVEAMAAESLIASHNNIFNKSVLGDDALYFNDEKDISRIINNFDMLSGNKNSYVNNNLKKVEEKYTWDKIINDYFQFIKDIHDDSEIVS